MAPDPRRSYPPATSSLHPTEPTTVSRTSSIFPYSTARPPTNYSQQSWLPRNIPPVPPPHVPARGESQDGQDPFGGIVEEDEDDMERETPLYARSDWDGQNDDSDGSETTGGTTTGTDTAWSRSSFALTTAPPRQNGTGLGEIREEDENSPRSGGSGGYEYAYGDGLVQSPGMMSATPTSSKWGQGGAPLLTPGMRTPGTPHTPWSAVLARGNREGRDSQEIKQWGKEKRGTYTSRKSSLPSVLDLEHLTKSSKKDGGGARDPFADTPNRTTTLPDPSTFPIPLTPPDGGSGDGGGQSTTNLMTPGAHQKLGRMSVAPARYTLPGQSSSPSRSLPHSTNGSSIPGSLTKVGQVGMVGGNGVKRTYLAYRPFITAGLCLIAALLLTISLQNTQGPVGRYVVVKQGAFSVSPSGVGDVALGVNGWCPLTGEACRQYTNGDFGSGNSSYTIPGDPLLGTLGDLLTALTALTWLLALYNLVTAFLHLYLFFALSIPFTHLVDETSYPNINTTATWSREGDDSLDEKNLPDERGMALEQVEVDIRVRCERPPYEGYAWVWWAWWGHRRSPVGYIYAIPVSVVAVSSFAIAFSFKRSVAKATSGGAVSLGAGSFVPLIALLFTLDALVGAVQWFIRAGASWKLLFGPPEPSPAAIMLPTKPKPMAHIRNISGSSFFAPRTTLAVDAMTGRETIPPLPGSDLDPETRRWLTAYPADPELVPLIASLRQKNGENDEFILSDQGLLYLRPDGDEAALLVPPAGDIRKEIIEDSHLAPDDESGHPIHLETDEIIDELAQTFWWMGMEDDVKKYVDGCAGCKYDKGGVGGIAGLKPGMTPVPFTGVTGWTAEMRTGAGGVTGGLKAGPGESAMAAEMAFAMRQAEEQAEKDRLG